MADPGEGSRGVDSLYQTWVFLSEFCVKLGLHPTYMYILPQLSVQSPACEVISQTEHLHHDLNIDIANICIQCLLPSTREDVPRMHPLRAEFMYTLRGQEY